MRKWRAGLEGAGMKGGFIPGAQRGVFSFPSPSPGVAFEVDILVMTYLWQHGHFHLG